MNELIDTDIILPGAEEVHAPESLKMTAARGAQRIDAFLSDEMADFTRSRLIKIIRGGGVSINGRACKPSARVHQGDSIEITVPPLEPSEVEPEDIPLDIIYEDEYLLVINKQKGLAAHPTPTCTSGTLVNALMFHCGGSLSGIGGQLRPGIVHRLDKDTSGVMAVAKTDAAHAGLAAQFSGRTVEKHYFAVVHGNMERDSGEVVAAIGRDPRDRKRMAVERRPGEGRNAMTDWRVEERLPWFTAVDLRLRTGRTHQARVHMAHIGRPIAGDPVYGGRKFSGGLKPDSPLRRGINDALEDLHGQALHARSLAFEHPALRKPMLFEAPPPADVREFIAFLKTLEET